MAAFAKSASTPRLAPKKVFKYPSEDECLVRRLGAGVLSVWSSLDPETQQRILAEASHAWDREFAVSKLPQKLEAFVKRHPGRLA
ncbi:MAG: hypothetical protein WBQ17_00520 [Rhizomicrobium sp.]|jgi:hypothetical protein